MTMTKIKKVNFLILEISKTLKSQYLSKLIYRTAFNRNNKKKNIDTDGENLINSAVLCLLEFSEAIDSFNILLTLRSKNLKNHSGQICFPGGKLEKFDKDFEICALREAEEEIGVYKKNIEILGKMNKYSTGTGFLIQPIIAQNNKESFFKINLNEVEEVISFPINYLFKKKNLTTSKYISNINKKEYYYYDIKWKDYRIWGATAMILVDLTKIIKNSFEKYD